MHARRWHVTRKVLHSTRRFAIIHPRLADIAQKVEHILGKDEVTSSTLVISSKRKCSESIEIPGIFGYLDHKCILMHPCKMIVT